MAPPQSLKRRKAGDNVNGRILKRNVRSFKKQTDYKSDSSDDDKQDFQAVNLDDSEDDGDEHKNPLSGGIAHENEKPMALESDADSEITDESSPDHDSEDDGQDLSSNPNLIRKRKRNDPEAFATSMSKILSSKLSNSKRSDPVLSRSTTALQASKEITDRALETKAKRMLREEKRAALDKGRVKDVLGASIAFDAEREDMAEIESTAEIVEVEKRLRKTAQRGVVKLFNAVRAAQIKGEEAAKEARKKGLVGYGRREERVNEMSKKGFLDLIAERGGGLKNGIAEEARLLTS